MTGEIDPAALLARSAKLKVYAMLRRTVDAAGLRANLGAHLTWMIGAEQAGHIMLSGPVAPRAEATPLDGLTIIRADSMEAAEALARQDPFVQLGVVHYEMREWTLNEGCIPLTVTLSDSGVVFR